MGEKKKLDWEKITLIIFVVFLVILFAKASALKQEAQELKRKVNQYANEVKNLQDEIDAIYTNVDEQLKKQASLLSVVEYSFGKLNADQKLVEVEFAIVPKEIFEGMKITVTIDGNTTALERNGSVFTGTADVGLFLDYEKYPILTITSPAGGTKTECLDTVYVSDLFANFLPELNTNMGVSNAYSGGKLTVDMDFSVDYKPAADQSAVTFTSFTMIEEINGKEVGREDISEKVREENDMLRADYKKEFSVSKGDELKIYVEAEDSLGFLHKALVNYWYEQNGATAETVNGGESIYDKDGKLLH